jgi:hypothetical protein
MAAARQAQTGRTGTWMVTGMTGGFVDLAGQCRWSSGAVRLVRASSSSSSSGAGSGGLK